MAKISINIASGSIEKKKVVVGIDLGTTNSLVAYMDADVPTLVGQNQGVLVPSVVYFDANNFPIVGSRAKEFIAKEPERTIFSVKRLLGKSYQDIDHQSHYVGYKVLEGSDDNLVKIAVGDRFYNPIQLSAIILRELKERAELALNAQVEQAVITVPAYFNDAQRQATRDAGKLAGLDVLRIINEPTAASLAYGFNQSELDKTILVYDLGGGTFDVSILKLEHGVFEVLSTHGNTHLGGDDLDRAVVDHWLQQWNLNYSQLSREEQQSLRLLAETAKISLSNQPQTPFQQSFTIANAVQNAYITFKELKDITQPLIDQTLHSVRLSLKDAQLSHNQIDEVVLVGGSTRFPEIITQLSDLFPGVHINNSLNPDEVVALGAAVEADILAGNRKGMLLLDVTPLSLGIETAGDLMDVLIPRNSKIPQRVGRQYTTSVDGQVNLKVAVYQGERELVSQNRKLGEFILSNIPAMPAGLPKIEIQFAINADGLLTVAAKELRSGIAQEVEIQPTYGLTDNQVEDMLQSGLINAREDVETRLNREAENEAKQLVYTAERFIEKNGSYLSEEEILGTKQHIQTILGLLDTGDRHQIHSAVESLNDYTRPFAERLMDVAISTALKGNKLDEL